MSDSSLEPSGSSGPKIPVLFGAVVALIGASVYQFYQVRQIRADLDTTRETLLDQISKVHETSTVSSKTNRESVDSIVARATPVTASLVFGGAVLWLTMALPLGVLAALRPRTLVDRSAMGFALIGISAHPIWIGLVLSYVFGYRLGLTPIEGYCNMFRAPPGECSGVIPWAEHMILPWITFMMLFAALYIRLIRAAMMETLTEDYVRTARAKGVGPRRLLFHHVLRNSLLPVVTIFGMDLGLAIGAALFTENVFGLPGLGNQMLQAYTYADLPSITGITLFAAICVVALNLIVDVLYSVLDPRIVLTS